MKKIKEIIGIIVLLSAFAFTAPAMAQQNNVISIENVQVAPGESMTTPILINNATSVAGIKVNLSYNPAIVNVTNATLGNFDDSPHKLDLSNAKNGSVKIYVVEYSGLSGNKTVANVELTGVGSAYAASGLDISLMSLKNNTGLAVTGSTENGLFTILTPILTPTEPPAGGGGGGAAVAPHDTIGDGTLDYDETLKYRTDPKNADSDGGVIDDSTEVARGTDPLGPTDDVVSTPMLTPTLSSFKAIFAIAGLLAVAYLVLRRKK